MVCPQFAKGLRVDHLPMVCEWVVHGFADGVFMVLQMVSRGSAEGLPAVCTRSANDVLMICVLLTASQPAAYGSIYHYGSRVVCPQSANELLVTCLGLSRLSQRSATGLPKVRP